jgi:hypothetical protein
VYVYFFGEMKEREKGIEDAKEKGEKLGGGDTGVYSVQYQKKVVLDITAYNSAGPTVLRTDQKQKIGGWGGNFLVVGNTGDVSNSILHKYRVLPVAPNSTI